MTEIGFIKKFLVENMAYAREKFAAREAITVTSKRNANDLLTEVDLTLQKRAVDQIRRNFPGDQVVAEEGEFARAPHDPSARCWIMDPIDGTNNFVRGIFPVYAISIAFAIHGRTVASGIGLPGMDLIYLAEEGQGAFCGDRRLVVSEVQSLAEARVDLDFGGVEDRDAWLERGQELFRQAGQLRCHGSAVASIGQIASADLDAFVHMTLNPWDYAAAQLIVEEAGGMASRLDGKPLRLFDGKQGVLITNGAIHKEILRLLRK
ncbi:MAG: inositol monophosphatase [Candidatus Hydrogenedentes bacterium]|nr:inositol monophosphatase [Candidatus Hydrogenedentota bacterium]